MGNRTTISPKPQKGKIVREVKNCPRQPTDKNSIPFKFTSIGYVDVERAFCDLPVKFISKSVSEFEILPYFFGQSRKGFGNSPNSIALSVVADYGKCLLS